MSQPVLDLFESAEVSEAAEPTFPFRLICDGCGLLLGVVQSSKHSAELLDLCVEHVIPCAGAVNRIHREAVS